MSNPYLGEIRMVGFGFAPKNWALCNGQLLQINANQALFSILGTTYGGNGQTNFALPDLRGRVPLHAGTGNSGTYNLGQAAGEELHTLTVNEMPSHGHSAVGNSGSANQANAALHYWGNSNGSNYASTADGNMAAAAVGNAGSGQGHENRSPFQVLNFIICLAGVFPTRS